ncbi:MAG TPA: DUF4157 domain-containing protein [Kofleriaceae bacterium]|nr:DUF4157 domain-containing protein [Kofleriaceae bacterium]
MSFDRSRRAGQSPEHAASVDAPGPGKRTLTAQLDAAIQQRATAAPEADVHAAAAHGIGGSATTLPHLGPIQQAFGHHDVGHVQAHVGGAAAEGAAAMGASAFAAGDHVAFAGSPDLHTAAHEAAHVVQQRAGVQLQGGVGEVGDAYERHADAVADLVVQGKSAEAVLDQHAPTGTSGAPGGAVQRHAFLNGKQIPRTDPAVTGAMVDLVTDEVVRDYQTMEEFRNHAAGKTDYLGTLPGDNNVWLRFSPTGLNVLGEMHETASALEFVLPAVGSKSFISEAISNQAPAAGSQLEASYDAEHADRFQQFGIVKENDKTRFGAEPLIPKIGYGMTAVLPYLNLGTGTGDKDKNVHQLTKGNYGGEIYQTLLKEAWAWGKDTAVSVAAMHVAFAPVPPKLDALAQVVSSLQSVLDPFLAALPTSGFLGDSLALPQNAPLLLPVTKFVRAAIEAAVEQAATDPASRLTARQKKQLTGAKTDDARLEGFTEWRNIEIAASVKDAAARGVRYAGMGWAHMHHLEKSPPASTHIFDMNGKDIERFEHGTEALASIAVKQR